MVNESRSLLDECRQQGLAEGLAQGEAKGREE